MNMVRIPSNYCRAALLLGVSLATARGAIPAIPPALVLQDIVELQTLAAAEASAHLPPLTGKQRLLAGPIPPGTRLARCTSPPTASGSPAPHMNDRVLVEVRCQGVSAWHL